MIAGYSIMKVDGLLTKAEKGLDSLKVSRKYIDSTLKWLRIWLTDKAFRDYAAQIEHLINTENWNFLLDSFYQVIPFGTGGRRGLVGVGPNRINTWTIQASAQGHSQYLIRQYGDEARQRGVVLTFDVRKYTQTGIYDDTLPNPVRDLDGHRLATAAAEVYAANDIKVYMFESVRSTPELSYAIRHLKAISGDMFSASHNLTGNVDEIKMMAFEKARAAGLIELVGEQVDDAYYDAVSQVSLSNARDIKIVYSPLHGTGLTSVYPILKKLGFDVTLDPETSNLSGAFENVTFNIPNPEVIESFSSSLPHAKNINADLLISTDPDADRIGVMLNHRDSWQFLTGNEIGIILTNYAIAKYASLGRLSPNSTIIKTEVTTSLMQKIAAQNGVRTIGDLLVGFKYIADVMNRIEADGNIDDFIFGAEESHGYLTGNYARDKDAACAAIWLAEHAAELKKKHKTLLDDLNDIYASYGYCLNYLTEIRLLGARGMEQIAFIMDHLRDTHIEAFGDFAVKDRLDRRQGDPQPHLSQTDTSARNILIYYFEDTADTAGIRVTVRPSGTEPKIKMYVEVIGKPCSLEKLEDEKQKITAIREKLEKTFMQYCYRLLDVDFPDRGFLLFWQLPLVDKLKYFEIEDDIANLKGIADSGARKAELENRLKFLGANPIEKIDKAFKARFDSGIEAYLDLNN